jgi:hypothetical protein
LERKAIVKSADGRPFGRLSIAKKLTFAVLVLGAVAAAGLGAVTTADFRSKMAAMLATGEPVSIGSPASTSKAVKQRGPNDDIVASEAAPERSKGVWLERWWMDLQESVKHAE